METRENSKQKNFTAIMKLAVERHICIQYALYLRFIIRMFLKHVVAVMLLVSQGLSVGRSHTKSGL